MGDGKVFMLPVAKHVDVIEIHSADGRGAGTKSPTKTPPSKSPVGKKG
jgi:hypothetical protein